MLTDRLQGGRFLGAPRKMTAIVAVGPGTKHSLAKRPYCNYL
jgi:hypothetical protein